MAGVVPTNFDGILQACGLSAAARTLVTDATDGEGLTLADLQTLSSEDVDDLVEAIRKPGGQRTNPLRADLTAARATWERDYAAAANDAERTALGPKPQDPTTVPEFIPNAGAKVTAKGTKRLKAACFLARHVTLTQRHTGPTMTDLDPAIFTRDRLHNWETYMADFEKHEDPEEIVKLKQQDAASVVEFIDDFEQALSNYAGAAGSLAYVIRMTDPPAAAGDPPFGEGNSIYPSIQHEIAARAAPDAARNPHFPTDNARVFDLLSEAIANHKQVLTWVKSFRATKDGRNAWTAFRAHYLGASQMDGIANRAEARIEKSVYSSEQARYSFERHVTLHHKAHQDIAQATGVDLSDRDKVRRFLLTVKAPFMQVPIATVKATPNLRTNWEECINYLRDFVPALNRFGKANSSALTVGEKEITKGDDTECCATTTNGTKRKFADKTNGQAEKKKPKQLPKIEDRWYKPSEWSALLKAGKGDEIKALRAQRGEKKKDKP